MPVTLPLGRIAILINPLLQTYVQQLICQNGANVSDSLTKQNSHLYICGDIHMAHDVTNCLITILCQHCGFTVHEANQYILHMKVN